MMDRNASGFGQIEVTRWAVFQGTYTAEQAAALYTAASTYKIPAGLWSTISVVNNAGTITHYLNGAAHGSGATTASNAFTALRFGTDGSTFYDGQLAAFIPYNTAKTPAQELAKATRMAVEFWNRRAFRTAITDVTTAPLYAWLEEVHEWLWAKLLPVPGGVR